MISSLLGLTVAVTEKTWADERKFYSVSILFVSKIAAMSSNVEEISFRLIL